MPEPQPNHSLACRVVSAHTGAAIADVKSVIGRGEVNDVCIVTTGDGAKFVVRSHERTELARYRKEVWAISRAAAAGVAVAPVLASGQTAELAWMLQPLLPGTPGDELEPDTHERVWRSIGQEMHRIHGVPVGGFGETVHAMTAGGRAGWREYLAYNLGELTDRDPLLHLGLLDRDAQAQLRERFTDLTRGPTRLGLCHGDLSLKNVIVDDGSVQVIDWGCAHGHLVPHYDLGVILAESLVEHSPEFVALLDGYGLDPTSFSREARADVFNLRALEAVDKVRWALDRNPTRLPALSGRMVAALRAAGIVQQSASDLA